MADSRIIKCHQFLSGRFHEGYGRNEFSREEVAGRKKQTINYEMINLEGRNNFCYDGYQAYEIEPTHADWKQPGVFCITNGVENGSQAARTYALIPESGKVADALDVLRQRPVMPLEEFSEYDYGRKTLSWAEINAVSSVKAEYVLTEEAEKCLGYFLDAYWDVMSRRMVDPDNHDVICLYIAQETKDANECFRVMIDFFTDMVVSKLPAAVQSMISASFGVPWNQRRMHPATACIVTSDPKDLNANPLYGFSVVFQGGKYQVDTEEHSNANEPDVTSKEISEVLKKCEYPEVYTNIERHFTSTEEENAAPDHVILRAYDVIELLVNLDIRMREWDSLPDTSRPARATRDSQFLKKNFDILYKTFTRNCKIESHEAFLLLEPILDNLLEVMGTFDEGTEFENEFSEEDIPFFAACRMHLETIQEKTERQERCITRLNTLLIRNYELWSRQEFASSLEKGTEATETMPLKVFITISREALEIAGKEAEELIDPICAFINKNYQGMIDVSDPDIKGFIFTFLNVYKQDEAIGAEDIQRWETWLVDSKIKNDRAILMELVFGLYSRAFEKSSSVSTEYAASVYVETEALKNKTEGESIQNLCERAQDYLVEHFPQWGENGFTYLPDGKVIHHELFLPVAQQWLEKIRETETEDQEEIQKTEQAINRIKDYYREIKGPKTEETEYIASAIFSWYLEHKNITREFYDEQYEWLKSCKGMTEKQISVLLLPLANRLMDNDEAMQQAGIDFIGIHMELLAKFLADLPEETKQKATELKNREFNYLLENFAEWRQVQLEKGSGRRQNNEQLEMMVEQWQREALVDSELSSEELSNVRNSLSGIRKEDGTKLDLSALDTHILYAKLRESAEACDKECTPEALQLLAGYYQNFVSRTKEQDIPNYNELINNTSNLLTKHFSEWSEVGFAAGDREPDESFIPLADDWLDTLRQNRSAQQTSSMLDAMLIKLEALPIIQSKGSNILIGLKEYEFSTMSIEARNTENVDASQDWLPRFMQFYSDEENDDEARDNNERIVKVLDEACGRGNQKAKEYISEILERNNNRVPEAAARLTRWAQVSRERLSDAIRQLFNRFDHPEDLTDKKLSEAWKEDYSKEYSVEWEEIQDKEFTAITNEHLKKIYEDTPQNEKVEILQRIWKTAGERKESDHNSLAETERRFVADVLNREYSELWKNTAESHRADLDAFAEAILSVGYSLPDLEKSTAKKAGSFIRCYSETTKRTPKEYGIILNTVLLRPDWLGWIHFDELDAGESAITIAVKQHDITPEGIAMRLINDASVEQNGKTGSYWQSIFTDVSGIRTPSELSKKKPWNPENGRILNALSYLINAATELGEGGKKAIRELKQWLAAEAPEFINELCDKKKRGKNWSAWSEIVPRAFDEFIQNNDRTEGQ